MDTTATNSRTEAILLRSHAAGVATLTLNRPKQFNALSMEMLDALQAALDEVAADRTIRVVVIAANGKLHCLLLIHDASLSLADRQAVTVERLAKAE